MKKTMTFFVDVWPVVWLVRPGGKKLGYIEMKVGAKCTFKTRDLGRCTFTVVKLGKFRKDTFGLRRVTVAYEGHSAAVANTNILVQPMSKS